MKMKIGLVLASLLSTAVMAQTNAPITPPPLPVIPPPPNFTPAAPAQSAPTPAVEAPLLPPANTNKPPKLKKPTRKKAVASTNAVPDQAAEPKAKAKAKSKTKKADTNASALPPLSPDAILVPNEPALAEHSNINIRGQARISSEVIGHLQKGETVTVLEVVTLPHPKTDEPSKWARIALPASLHVWVDTAFVDGTTHTVKARKLNMRSGPGENYSVIGTLVKGDAITGVKTKGDWTEINAPTNAFAFVAAHMLSHKQPAPSPIPEPMPTPVVPVQTVVTGGGQIAPPPTEGSGGNALANGQLPQPQLIPQPIIPPALPAVEEPAPKRVIERDGIVGGTVSIQSPSHFELHNLDNGKVIDYLYTTSTNLNLGRYKGLTVHVTGEEELDERWPNTPVITIQKIQVVK